jgi:multidrug efflux pump subunit AcrA (membrane-fusion protein)
MKRKNLLISVAIVACAVLGIFAIIKLHAPSSGGGDDDDEVSANTGVEPIVTVQLGTLKRVTLHQYINGYGDIEAAPALANQAAGGGILAPPTAGIVAKVNVIAGQWVTKGQVLMELNSSSATFDYAKAEVDRQEKLFAQQNTSLKNLEDAQAQLASLEIIAPVSGTVTSVNVQPGQAVDPSMAVADVIDFKRLAVSTKIPAAQAAQLHTGEDVQLETDPPMTVPLSFVGSAVNPDDDTVPAWALLPPDTQLRPGQFVQLKIVTAVHTNALAAPADSVVTDESGNSTISLVNNGESAQTPVQTAFSEDGWVEVSGPGLKEGDSVVTVGAYGLDDKTKIKIAGPGGDTSATNSPVAQ